MSDTYVEATTSTPDEAYLQLPPEQIAARIARRKRELGDALLILAHHYQRDEIVQHADFVGDSLRLSQRAAEEASRRGDRTATPVRWIVFCGVHFMAETADVLTPDGIAVILPNRAALCPMAAMVEEQDLRDAWACIEPAMRDGRDNGEVPRVVPIAYVNSTAAVKAFVGRHGGACCTSSNAREVFEWALRRGGTDARRDTRILFVPDHHLGRNVSVSLGMRESDLIVWDPQRQRGGFSDDRIRAARVILWRGHCYVHTRFRAGDVTAAHAGGCAAGSVTSNGHEERMRVIVHPECTREVVDRADVSGSTEHIVSLIEDAPPGSRWAVGTEAHLVSRLARQAAKRGVEVRMLGRSQPMCGAMLRIAPPDLLWTLDHLAHGRIMNQVQVPNEIRADARLALDRMLQCSPREAGSLSHSVLANSVSLGQQESCD